MVYLSFFLSRNFTGKTIWQLVLEQFDDLLVKILLLAAIISFVSACDMSKFCILFAYGNRLDANVTLCVCTN